jgi:tetratricopeptide (TPR) repeat protein
MFRGPDLAEQPARSIINLAHSMTAQITDDEIIQVLQRLQPLYADDFWFNARLGAYVWQRGQSFEALSYYSAALAIRSSGPLHGIAGDILMKLRRFDEAIVHLQRAQTLNPDVYHHWEYLGQALHGVGRYEEAIEAFRNSLAAQPDSVFAKRLLGDSLRRAGQCGEAIQSLQEAVRRHPDDIWCQVYLGIALSSDGRNVEAMRVYAPLLAHVQELPIGVRIRQESGRILTAALAALAGDAKDADQLDDAERSHLRGQVLRWLQLRVEHGQVPDPELLIDDPAFAIVRDEEQLASMPDEDRAACEAFWDRLAAHVAEAQEEHERSSQAAAASSWQVLPVESATSSAGADLNVQPNGAILVSGTNQANDDYAIVTTVGPTRVTAVKLEVLTDPSLPNNGPGRHETGNFQLAEISIEAISQDSDRRSTLAIDRAWASYSWKERPVRNTIDGDGGTVWHVWGALGQPHVAVFTLKEPFEAANSATLIVKLRHGGELGPGIGRFRLSVTPDDWLTSVVDRKSP